MHTLRGENLDFRLSSLSDGGGYTKTDNKSKKTDENRLHK